MKALSIRQPWAWAILNLGKDVENRTWWTDYRGPVLIHAGKGMTRREYADACECIGDIAGWGSAPPQTLPRGGIVGMAEIIDCVSTSDSPWFGGPFGFVLTNVRPVPFRPYGGALGFFDVPWPLEVAA